MENSEKNLDNYIKKVIEIQQQQESQALSSEQLKQIAHNMGMTEGDLLRAKDAYLQRGKGFLQFQNYEDAIAEYQQAVILQPDSLDALFGLAKSYQNLWQKTGRKEYRENAETFAQKCLQINPNHQDSFRLISELKKPKNSAQTNTEYAESPIATQNARYAILAIAVTALIIVAGFVVFLLAPSPSNMPNMIEKAQEQVSESSSMSSTSMPSNASFEAIYSATGEKGSVVWSIYYIQEVGQKITRTHYLQIANPENGKVLKTIELAKKVDISVSSSSPIGTSLKYHQGKFYSIRGQSGNFLEARDIYTGEIVENNETLTKAYPELSAGIGFVNESAGWYELLTKDGQKFYYSPENQSLVSSVKREEVNKDWKNHTSWVDFTTVFLTDDSPNRKLYLFRQKISPFQLNNSGNFFARSEKEPRLEEEAQKEKSFFGEFLTKITDRSFINASLLYADNEIVVLRHLTEVSADAKPLITCISTQGKILWHNNNPNSLIINEMKSIGSVLSFNPNQYKNKLNLTRAWVLIEGKSYPFSCQIDLKTGKIQEYSPNYVKQN